MLSKPSDVFLRYVHSWYLGMSRKLTEEKYFCKFISDGRWEAYYGRTYLE